MISDVLPSGVARKWDERYGGRLSFQEKVPELIELV